MSKVEVLANIANQAIFSDNISQHIASLDEQSKTMYLENQQSALRQQLPSKSQFADFVEIVKL